MGVSLEEPVCPPAFALKSAEPVEWAEEREGTDDPGSVSEVTLNAMCGFNEGVYSVDSSGLTVTACVGVIAIISPPVIDVGTVPDPDEGGTMGGEGETDRGESEDAEAEGVPPGDNAGPPRRYAGETVLSELDAADEEGGCVGEEEVGEGKEDEDKEGGLDTAVD